MAELFEGPIENIIESLGRQRVGKRVFAIEAALEKRIAREGGSPIVEGNHAFFFIRYAGTESVSVVGDWNGWKHGEDKIIRINRKSSLCYLKKEFAMDARFPYRFALDGRDTAMDPLNPRVALGPLGVNSYFTMPAYRGIPYLINPISKIRKGKVLDHLVKGNLPIADRKVSIYIPYGLKLKGKHHFLFVNDGDEAISIGNCIAILDNLYHENPLLPRTIVVFVPPVDRHAEYMLNPKFADWFSNSLTTQVESKLKVTSAPELRAIQGASLGGLLASQVGLLYPKVFGNVVAQSASFWYDDKAIIRLYEMKKKVQVRFYIHTGTVNDALVGSHAMLRVLQQKGYDVTYRETTESHNWANWSSQYSEIVKWCVGR